MDTPIRVFLKKLRSDNNEVMSDMAEKLGVTTSFLSAVELGKKNPPQNWYRKIDKSYSLCLSQRYELIKALALSERHLKIDLTDLSYEKKSLVWHFRENLKDMNSEDVEILSEILNDINVKMRQRLNNKGVKF